MARKEEILEAAQDYINSVSLSSPLNAIYFLSSPLNVIHFEAGAKWADEHLNLERLWHDASEVPQENKYVLIQDEENDYDVVLTKSIDEWNTWCGTCKISRWAYISDLLPKGGEK